MRTLCPLCGGFALGLQLLLGAADLLLEFGLELFGSLVLGHLAKHDLEPFQLLLGRRRAAVLFFGLVVLGSEVGSHDAIIDDRSQIKNPFCLSTEWVAWVSELGVRSSMRSGI